MPSNIEPDDISDELCRQMEAVRNTGAVNMAYRTGVRDVADELGFDELVDWLDEHTSRNDMDAYSTLLNTYPDRVANNTDSNAPTHA